MFNPNKTCTFPKWNQKALYLIQWKTFEADIYQYVPKILSL